jgi:porphyrinogen peroxidase
VRVLSQPGILAPGPRAGRYLSFVMAAHDPALPATRPVQGLLAGLSPHVRSGTLVLGLGPDVLAACSGAGQSRVPGCRVFPALAGPAVRVPSTPVSLWCWLRGDDPGELLLQGRAIAQALAPVFVLQDAVDAFRYGRGPMGFGLDLSGYEDGIENPMDAAATAAALMRGQGPGLDGSSCASVQQWEHDFAALESMSEAARDAMVGRRRSDSEEIDDAPTSAHVKRTAQEDFEPPAFVLRRSMPWSAGREAGLVFVAFGASPDAFEAQLRRMVGLDDGVTDALFAMSRPLTGFHVWCPPMADGALDLRALQA